MYIQTANDAYTSATNLVTIQNNGFVGMGTSSPLAPLHLVTSGGTEQRVEGGAEVYYTLKDNSGPLNSKFIRIGDSAGSMYIQSVNDAYTSSTNLVTIQNNGFVGMGTSSPLAPLHLVTSGGTEQRVEGSAGAYYTLKDNS